MNQSVGVRETGGNRLGGLVPNLCFVLNEVTKEQHLLVNSGVRAVRGVRLAGRSNSVKPKTAREVQSLYLSLCDEAGVTKPIGSRL